MGTCAQCNNHGKFKFNNVQSYSIKFPDGTEKVVTKDFTLCDDHFREFWQQLRDAQEKSELS